MKNNKLLQQAKIKCIKQYKVAKGTHIITVTVVQDTG